MARPELTTFVALLRAVNVGATGKLPMRELKAMCEAAGFSEVRTFIASGNVVFRSGKSEAEIKAALEACLKAFAGKPVGVLVRTAAELAAVLKGNPFPEAAPNRTVAIFLNKRPPTTALAEITGQAGEEVRLGKREVYVHYRDGIGKSKLRIPAVADGTARNMNTIAKLTALAG
jgi:uncharacterized protein (DUF1697 family)